MAIFRSIHDFSDSDKQYEIESRSYSFRRSVEEAFKILKCKSYVDIRTGTQERRWNEKIAHRLSYYLKKKVIWVGQTFEDDLNINRFVHSLDSNKEAASLLLRKQ